MGSWPPRRKIIRELKRTGTRLMAMPNRFFATTLSSYYYDHFLAKTAKAFTGAREPGPKIAIYLIFPQDGVQPSHLASLTSMIDAGYAPLVISNLPLDEQGRGVILSRCWQLIERPNYGYDFGGYRDGILALKDRLADLSHLAVFNDSCWFPLHESQNWLKDAEALRLDMVGAVYHCATNRVKVADYQRTEWGFDPAHPRFHYGSFALLFGVRILKSQDFIKFWRRIPMTNIKDLTVRLGEVGLSRFVVSHGFSHGATCDLPALPALLADLDDNRLAQVLDNLVMPFDIRLRALQRQIEDERHMHPDWRTKAEALALASAVRTGAAYALSDLLIAEMQLPFLKKSPLWLERRASAAMLDVVSRLEGDVGDMIRAETKRIVCQRKPVFRTLEFELKQLSKAARRPE